MSATTVKSGPCCLRPHRVTSNLALHSRRSCREALVGSLFQLQWTRARDVESDLLRRRFHCSATEENGQGLFSEPGHASEQLSSSSPAVGPEQSLRVDVATQCAGRISQRELLWSTRRKRRCDQATLAPLQAARQSPLLGIVPSHTPCVGRLGSSRIIEERCRVRVHLQSATATPGRVWEGQPEAPRRGGVSYHSPGLFRQVPFFTSRSRSRSTCPPRAKCAPACTTIARARHSATTRAPRGEGGSGPSQSREDHFRSTRHGQHLRFGAVGTARDLYGCPVALVTGRTLYRALSDSPRLASLQQADRVPSLSPARFGEKVRGAEAVPPLPVQPRSFEGASPKGHSCVSLCASLDRSCVDADLAAVNHCAKPLLAVSSCQHCWAEFGNRRFWYLGNLEFGSRWGPCVEGLE